MSVQHGFAAAPSHRCRGRSIAGQRRDVLYDHLEVSGLGERFRVTVMGPGVTPDVQWEGYTLGAYDADAEKAYTALFDQWIGGDPACAAER